MSGTLPSLTLPAPTRPTAANLPFRPFADLDLEGGSVTGAQIVYRIDEASPINPLTGLPDDPLPGFASITFTATDTEVLQNAIAAGEFNFLGTVPLGLVQEIEFTLTIFGGTSAAPLAFSTGITVPIGQTDGPTTILGLPSPDPSIGDTLYLEPFLYLVLADPDPGVTLTLTVRWEARLGSFIGGPDAIVDPAGMARLIFTGTPEAVRAAAAALVFQPQANLVAEGSSQPVPITLTVDDGTNDDAVRASFAIVVRGVQDQPAIFNIEPLAQFGDDESLNPFFSIDISDPDAEPDVIGAQLLTATVTLSVPLNGSLASGSLGSYDAAGGQWSFTGSRPEVEAALEALVFTPTQGLVAVGETVTTLLYIAVSDGIDTAQGFTTAIVTANPIPIEILDPILDFGPLPEGTLSADILALILANFRTAVPGREALVRVDSLLQDDTQGIATLDSLAGSLRFEADGFNALAPTDSFRYVLTDGIYQAIGTVRFTISGPSLPTRLGTPGDDMIVQPGWYQRVIGGHGADTITAGGGDNRIFGGWGDDVIVARGWGNTVEGGPGNDRIDAGLGNATVDGGAGDNVIVARGSLNIITAGDGDNGLSGPFTNSTVTFGDGDNRITLGGWQNRVTLGDGRNSVTAGAGNSSVIGGDGGNLIVLKGWNNLVQTGAGADDISAGPGNSTIASGAGDDIIRLGNGFQHRIDAGAGQDRVTTTAAGGGNHSIDLGSGNDFAALAANATTLIGGEGADRLSVNGNWNLLQGGLGADTLTGSGLGNTLQGGDGDDRIVTTAGGQSRLQGGEGQDRLTSGTGADTLDGGAGADSLDGGLGNDVLIGGAGADTLRGGAGRDILQGGLGDDLYIVDMAGDVASEAGGDGQDTVQSSVNFVLGAGIEVLVLTGAAQAVGWGNAGANSLTGNVGNNLLNGLQGADRIDGGAGADTLVGHLGADTLIGGDGADAFRYSLLAEAGDRILDFAPIDDRIEVVGASWGAGLLAGMDVAAAGRFALGPASSAAGIGQFTYNAATGVLAWDANGVAAGGVTPIATLTAGLSFTAADIVIV
jgi:Ca2+-binding RTX toxin-like protein